MQGYIQRGSKMLPPLSCMCPLYERRKPHEQDVPRFFEFAYQNTCTFSLTIRARFICRSSNEPDDRPTPAPHVVEQE